MTPVVRNVDSGAIYISDKYRDGSGYRGLEVELWGNTPTRVRLKMSPMFALELAASLVRRVTEGYRSTWQPASVAQDDPGAPIRTAAVESGGDR